MGKKKDKKAANETIESIEDDSAAVEATEEFDEKAEYEKLCRFVNAIAQPLANRKVAKKVYKLIKKASKEKHYLRQGIVEVQKAIRKGETGLVVLAGDVSPIEIYCHIPAVCEEKDIPYAFTPSRYHLGVAAGHKRACIVMLIKEHPSYQDSYTECEKIMKQLPVGGIN